MAGHEYAGHTTLRSPLGEAPISGNVPVRSLAAFSPERTFGFTLPRPCHEDETAIVSGDRSTATSLTSRQLRQLVIPYEIAHIRELSRCSR